MTPAFCAPAGRQRCRSDPAPCALKNHAVLRHCKREGLPAGQPLLGGPCTARGRWCPGTTAPAPGAVSAEVAPLATPVSSSPVADPVIDHLSSTFLAALP